MAEWLPENTSQRPPAAGDAGSPAAVPSAGDHAVLAAAGNVLPHRDHVAGSHSRTPPDDEVGPRRHQLPAATDAPPGSPLGRYRVRVKQGHGRLLRP